jgi:hypothetical protein
MLSTILPTDTHEVVTHNRRALTDLDIPPSDAPDEYISGATVRGRCGVFDWHEVRIN